MGLLKHRGHAAAQQGVNQMSARERVHDIKKRILIVEDDADIIKSQRELLSDRFTVIIKSSGAQAIRYLKENPDIDLALLDIKLPDMSGIEVLKEIKKLKPCVPAIIITAFGNENVAVKAFRCGARDYVKKPFSNDELVRRIDFCLSLNIIEQAKHRTVLTNEADELAADFVCSTTAGRKNHHLLQALKYIHNNFSTDISLDQVAGTAGISKYHFCRCFKEMTGLTYQSYLNRVRIEQAKKFLHDDALSITDTGYAVGYSDLTHFERIFKKLTGTTPSQYRRRTPSLPAALWDHR
jgi:two-component system, response regulator YesN